MEAKFYWENNNAGNCILINFREKWYCDDATPSGKWCDIDIYEDCDGRSTEECYAPALKKLKSLLENPKLQGYEFEKDYIENLYEIEAYKGKTIEKIEELENDDGYGCRRNHDNSTIVYIGKYDVYDPQEEKIQNWEKIEEYITNHKNQVVSICYKAEVEAFESRNGLDVIVYADLNDGKIEFDSTFDYHDISQDMPEYIIYRVAGKTYFDADELLEGYDNIEEAIEECLLDTDLLNEVYDTIEDGIYGFILNIKNNYVDYGLLTADAMNPKYAEDPMWSSKVNKYIEKIKNS